MERLKADLLLKNAGVLACISDRGEPRRSSEMMGLDPMENGALAALKGKIVWLGKTDKAQEAVELLPDGRTINANGFLVTPGLVDPHTHPVFAGWREDEFRRRLQGMPYLQIAREGGGILKTVRETKAATIEEILTQALFLLKMALAHGTTALEAKSGYGLDWESERKLLRAIQRLGESVPQTIIPTFLGAHSVPPEYSNDPDSFVDKLVEEMLPKVKEEGLARFSDVFCEEGAFSLSQARRILLKAKELGLSLKIHAEEFNRLGGTLLACELQATSADHLLKVNEEDIDRLGKSDVIAVLLPGTAFALKGEFPLARAMIERGVAVALGTDFNPGTSLCPSQQIMMNLACFQLGMSAEEALVAATLNAAYAIGEEERRGSLDTGKAADFLLWKVKNVDLLPYLWGVNLVDQVFIAGRRVA